MILDLYLKRETMILVALLISRTFLLQSLKRSFIRARNRLQERTVVAVSESSPSARPALRLGM